MAKAKTKTNLLHQVYDKPWKHALGAVAGIALAYGGASWAIDSGRLSVYALTLFLISGSIWHIVSAIKMGHAK